MPAETGAIHAVHWDRVRLDWRAGVGDVFAVWPAPVDHDRCFARAGFADFADTDDAWDGDLRRLSEELIAALGRFGESRSVARPQLRKRPSIVRALLRAVGLAPEAPADDLDALIAALTRDDLGPWETEFGVPTRAAMLACHGHPIFWIWLAEAEGDDPPEWLATMARGLPLQATRLRWDVLAPSIEEVP